MTGRLLPAAEWPRLKGTELEAAWPHLNPATAQIWVVEDGERIVGTWATYPVVHADGLWIDPDYRGSFGVAKRLMLGMRSMASYWGVGQVVTAAVNERVEQLLEKWRGKRASASAWILPVEKIKPGRLSDAEIGASFHAQVRPQVEHEVHEDDGEHNLHVGRALRRAVQDGEPEAAAAEYNAIADRLGYDKVTYLGRPAGRLRALSANVIFEVDDDYRISVVGEACQQAQS